MKTSKKDFIAALKTKLTEKGIEINEDQIKSALGKFARHQRDTIGYTDYALEIDNGMGNIINYYREYKQKNTFNREMRRQNRFM